MEGTTVLLNGRQLRLNIGCGNDIRPGWINIDLKPPCDIVMSINALKFDEASVDEIICYHVLEHVHDLVGAQKELARVLKPGANLDIYVPHYLSVDAWGDPSHVRAFSEMSFIDEFWVGFRLLAIQTEEWAKTFLNLKTYFIHATLKRNHIPYGELNGWKQ